MARKTERQTLHVYNIPGSSSKQTPHHNGAHAYSQQLAVH